MDFNYSEEQQLLAASLARWLQRDYGFEHRRTILRSTAGWSPATWAQFAELGLLALPLPAEHGGMDGSAVDLALVMQALGRALVLEPYLASSVLGAGPLAELGDPAQRAAVLPAVADGSLRLALAHHEASAHHAALWVETHARREGDDWILDGCKSLVLGGGQAHQLLISARIEGRPEASQGLCVFLVPADSAGLTLHDYPLQDGQRAAELVMRGLRLPATALLGAPGAAAPALLRVRERAIAALCAEAVGVMERLNAATLEYLKTRKQFGVPIGRFQVLQHRMVDMYIATEQARSMALLAAVKADAPDPLERARCLAAAKHLIGRSARLVGQQAVQLHGGMGVTDELDVAHGFKRLCCIDLSFGNAEQHLADFSDALLATAAA